MESINSGFRFLRLVLVIAIAVLLIFVNFTAAITFASDEDDDGSYQIHFDNTTDKLIESMEEIDDQDELGIYVPYDDSYKTRKYSSWQDHEHGNETLTIAQHSVVVRLGTRLRLAAPTDTDISITPSNEDMTPLNVYYENEFYVDIPLDGTIGRYTIDGEWDGGTDSLDLFVIHDPWDYSISEEEREMYAYDEESTRDERSYIFTTDGELQPSNLNQYGGENGKPDIYEFALEAVSGTIDPQEAAVRLCRIVAQRAEAVPSPLGEYQPMIRDASEILFGEGTTFYHGQELEHIGLEIEDAEILAENDQTLDNIQNPDEYRETKLINAWCDETSIALTGLLRSIGIPSRIVSLHPKQEHIEGTEMMGHFTVEVWFESSMYDKSWSDEDGDWYVIDADEWNAEWYVAEPIFWSFIGESFSSRANYGNIAELFFRDNPSYDYEIENFFILGEETHEGVELVDVTTHYNKDPPQMEYGSVTKNIARGGGDLYRLNIDETSKLSLDITGGVRPNIYIKDDDFPALSITYKGYPPDIPDQGLTDDEIILPEGNYFVGIYAPQEGSQKIEGNYGRYKLTLEKTPDATPAGVSESIDHIKVEEDYGKIKLNWSQPEDNGSPILYYNIFRDGKLIGQVNSTTYTDRDVLAQKKYHYTVSAVNAMGEGEKHEEIETVAARSVYRERPLTATISIILLVLWFLSYLVIRKFKNQ